MGAGHRHVSMDGDSRGAEIATDADPARAARAKVNLASARKSNTVGKKPVVTKKPAKRLEVQKKPSGSASSYFGPRTLKKLKWDGNQ